IPEFIEADAEPEKAGEALAELDPELAEIFLEEAQELIANSGELLHQWQSESDNFELVGELQRDLHTLKGGARMAEVTAIGDLSHELETLFERTVDAQTVASDEVIELCLKCHDALAAMVDSVEQGLVPSDASALLQSVQAVISGKSIGSEEPSGEATAAQESPEISELEEQDPSAEQTPSVEQAPSESDEPFTEQDSQEIEVSSTPDSLESEPEPEPEPEQQDVDTQGEDPVESSEPSKDLESETKTGVSSEADAYSRAVESVNEALTVWSNDEEHIAGVPELQQGIKTLLAQPAIRESRAHNEFLAKTVECLDAFVSGDLQDWSALQKSVQSGAQLLADGPAEHADQFLRLTEALEHMLRDQIMKSRSKAKAEEDDAFDQEVLEMFAEEAQE
ncbi:Hpt domain-containing protein, partial [Oleiphilus sp. HI0079]